MVEALTTTLSNKPFGISQIRTYIPIILGLDKINYDVWCKLFETYCIIFGVFDHLDSTAVSIPATEKPWKERDGLVKMWIYGIITNSLVETILKPKSTAHQMWLSIEELSRDNKEIRALQLENELRTITIGDFFVQEYYRKLKNLSDLLTNVDSSALDRALVMHCLNGLSEKFDGIHNVIRHRSPFPSFHTARSMLLAEEDRLSKQVCPAGTHTQTPSSPNVLYASENSAPTASHQTYNNNNRRNTNNNNRSCGGRSGGRGNRGRGKNTNFGNSGYRYPP